MMANELTSTRLRRLRDSSWHFPSFSCFTPEPSNYTYGLIQNDFMLTKPLIDCIEGSDNQNNLKHNYESLVSDNVDFQHIASIPTDVLEMSADVDSGARALIFGLCIAASIAIKNQTSQRNVMRQSMLWLFDEAMLLKAYYVRRSNTVRIQPDAYNVMLNLICAIIDNTISTTELIFQANRDCSIELITPPSQVNRIFADLVYFVLYKATRHLGNEYDCLATKTPFTTIDRDFICRYLNIRCQRLLIGSNAAKLHLKFEGREDIPRSHTIVISQDNTRLLLDADMKRQLRREKKNRGAFGDPEIRFASTRENTSHLRSFTSARYSFFQNRRRVTFADSVSYPRQNSAQQSASTASMG